MVSGGEHKTKKVLLKGDKVHPSVERAVKIIKESFQKLCLEDQDILGKSARTRSIRLQPSGFDVAAWREPVIGYGFTIRIMGEQGSRSAWRMRIRIQEAKNAENFPKLLKTLI